MRTSNNSDMSRAACLRALLVLLSGSVLVCRPAVGQQTTGGAVAVTISVFSGRKDPEFAIRDAAVLASVASYLKTAAPYRGPVKAPIIKSTLGYRGTLVETRDAAPGLPKGFSVYQGVIEVRGEQVVLLADKNRGLERRLLDQALASKAIDAKLHAQITTGW